MEKEESRKMLTLIYDKLRNELDDCDMTEIILEYVNASWVEAKSKGYDLMCLNVFLEDSIDTLKKAKEIVDNID